MKKILAFAGSISSTSINKQLAVYAAGLLDKVEYDILNMNEYPAPLFSIDEEKNGFPENMLRLSERLKTYDGFIISLAEHNGSYAAAYKNTIDWLSRIELKVFNKKPMLLMSASPGGRGGASVLAAANAYYPHLVAEIIANFSLPKFYDHFKEGKITDAELDHALENAVSLFLKEIQLES
ncbi:MAG: NADPH-dependent FMN reductase [Flavobacteriaceae bacterium]|nr:MAG: NADPH-dependent FMN reductase [Flavobacteriaceae bacterium]